MIVFDCNAICYRAFFVYGKELTHEERSVGIIYGFLKMLPTIVKGSGDTGPFIFSWDSKKSYRRKVYPEYKAGRRKSKSDMTQQDFDQFIQLRTEVLPAMGFKNIVMKTGYESDDLMAYIVYEYYERTNGEKATLVTNDNDMYQCLHQCNIYDHGKKITLNRNWFKNKYGIEPTDWSMAKAIGGCNGDEVEGIKGCGDPKKETSFALKYIKGELKKGMVFDRIKNGREIIDRNLPLVTLPYKGPVPLKMEYLVSKHNEVTRKKIIEVFDKYRFVSLLAKNNMALWKRYIIDNQNY